MQFIRSDDMQEGQVALLARLTGALQADKNVLWLVSGGSNIPLSVNVMKLLPDELTTHLVILPSDERFGSVGHADSNQAQLLSAGFASKQAAFLPVLLPDMSLEATRRHYDAIAQKAFREADIVIGQFGIGSDGHIAGILPRSPAVNTPDFVAAYETSPFTRLTLTFHALKRVSAAYTFAFGEAKQAALKQLKDDSLPFAEQPSQILKELPEAYVYNDEVGD